MSDSPTIEGLLGPKPPQTIEGILGPKEIAEPASYGGEYFDAYFTNQAAGRILDIFGQGAKEGFGTQPLGVPQPVEDWFKKEGLWNDHQKGQNSILREFNEGLMRSTALAADLALNRLPNAIYHGLGDLAIAAGVPRDIVAMPEAFMGDAAVLNHPAFPHLMPLEQAHDLGIVPEEAPGMSPREAARTSLAPTGEPSRTERVILPAEEEVAPQPVTLPDTQPGAALEDSRAPQDAHSIARQLEPDLFNEYDELVQRHATYSRWLDELADERQNSDRAESLQANIDEILGKVGGVESRLTQRAAERLERFRGRLDQYLATDTPDMALVRRNRVAADERMRDLAPDVSDAYQRARAQLPPPDEPTPAPPPPEAEIVPFPTRAPTGEPIAAPEPQAIQSLAQRRPSIQSDVARQLIEAGRPAEEARASAALVQAHYEARAARFEGQLGSARELYENDDPTIALGKGKQRGQLDLIRGEITLFKDADASTFVHESAHQWLEEMFRDAQHEKAPADLKADLDVVKGWLGEATTSRRSPAGLDRAQHEKFARGFERYLMEGTAPSPKLAGVFAKFKDWLTKIYQTVSRLRSPINDQIRGVYDRLLAGPPREAVIAPEREVALNFADVHENDLATAPKEPELAERRADEIAAEREQIAGILRAEINEGRRRARIAGPQRAAEGGAGGANVPAEGGARAGAAAVREDTAPQPVAVSPSGATYKAKVEAPEGPNDPFEPSDGRLIDRAGNIRLDNLNAPDEVDEIIRGAARYNNNFIESRRGIVTDGMMLDLADALGKDATFLDRKAIGEAFNAEEVLAARKLLVESATNVRARMLEAAESGDPLELAKALEKHDMIAGKVAQASAEWGRAGRAFRALEEFNGDIEALDQLLKDNGGAARSYDRLMQMARLGSQLQTPAQVARFTNGTRGLHPVVFYYWNSLISGPLTHAVYFAGNMIRAVGEPLLETPVAATIGALRGDADRVYFKEVGAGLYGLIKGFQDALPQAKAAFKTGTQIPLPGQRGAMAPFGFMPPTGGPLIQAIGLPGKSVTFLHQLGMGIRYEQSIQRQAIRTALEEGKSGVDLEARTAHLTQNPTDEMMTEAGQHALTEMYMRPTEFNSLASAIQKTAHKTVVGQIMFPFIKIGIELQRETFIKHTPIGLVDKEVRNQLLQREGGAAFDTAAAKQMIGIGMLGSGVAMATAGLLTGYGPPDPNQRRTWLLNHQPYSVQIGNLQIPYQGLGPIGKLLQFGADSYEAVHFWDGEKSSVLATNYMKAIARAALDESIFRDMTDLHDAINDPQQHAARWLYNFVPGWLPYSSLLGQVNRRFFDPYSHEVNGVFDAIRARVPVWSWYVPDRYDPFGQPILARGIHFNRYADDPTAQLMDRLGVKVGRLDKKIAGVELTQDQFDDYSRNAGVLSKQLLDNAVPRLETAPRHVQLLEINRILEAARTRARALIKAQSIGGPDDIIRQAIKLKRKALTD